MLLTYKVVKADPAVRQLMVLCAFVVLSITGYPAP